MKSKIDQSSSPQKMYVLGERLLPDSIESQFTCVEMPTDKAVALAGKTGNRIFEAAGFDYYYMGMSNQPMSQADLRPWTKTT